VVTTLHDLYPYDRPRNFGYPRVLFNRLSLRQALRESDRIICVSESTLGRLRQHFPRIADPKAVCIQNAVHLAWGASPAESVISPPYLLAVAQHRANKNLGLLLESFCLCKQTKVVGSDTPLVIVGSDGPETPHLHRLAEKLSIAEDVLFLSRLRDDELSALYQNCELFVSLSDIEGFDLPMAEAILLQARVVASDIPAHREIAGDQCEYVKISHSRAVDSVVKAMQIAMQRPRPSSKAISHFLPAVAGSKYVAEYQHVLAATGKAEWTRNVQVTVQ
jgi:glycosyltransferase involved in cell wall biosynthesis